MDQSKNSQNNRKNHRASQGLVFEEPTIFHKQRKGVRGFSFPDPQVEREKPKHSMFKERKKSYYGVTELEVVRHFTRMSQWNYSIDHGMFPLGSCTMKYNPKINEEIASIPGFRNGHPYTDDEYAQGALELMWHLERTLAEITGFAGVTLQPSAGAQGEYVGIKIMNHYHRSKGRKRSKVLIPDSAHGTNPATCRMMGFEVVPVPVGDGGVVEPDVIRERMDDDVAGMMITNPNTVGLFETHIKEICDILHEKDALVYCDGANLNAMMGLTRPGDQGADIMHMNLHKTFSTPHGGGGPGAGPVGVREDLLDFLPGARVKRSEKAGEVRYSYEAPPSLSIGRVRAGLGNFNVLVRALSYIWTMGPEGLKEASSTAILNANYLRVKLKDYYELPYDKPCMHEVVFSDKRQNENKVKALDIAKRLMDFGFHPPTMYFPLVVKGSLMIEPTETESLDELDQFVEAMQEIAVEAKEKPELVQKAPHLPVRARLDEVQAAKRLELKDDLK